MSAEKVYSLLAELGIRYEKLEHAPVYTIAEAMRENIPGRIEGTECKNLFLRSGDSYYLYVLEGDRNADLKALASFLNEKKLRFASAGELNGLLGLEAGSVTPLGVINDAAKRVTLVIDGSLRNRKLLVHPNVNTATIALMYEDLIRIAESTGHSCRVFEKGEL
ncbi:MAG: prolyl-tRNA synthetase associated domain-containing protein [Erysipelotrichaceae bacterium]|nr:prolyl-tRNA synthetase associated domain-containing protein [Erysipelotrichaceae bacterium]